MCILNFLTIAFMMYYSISIFLYEIQPAQDDPAKSAQVLKDGDFFSIQHGDITGISGNVVVGNLWKSHLVGGDWNHGILNDFPYIGNNDPS
jgi:hypothetical protein